MTITVCIQPSGPIGPSLEAEATVDPHTGDVLKLRAFNALIDQSRPEVKGWAQLETAVEWLKEWAKANGVQ